MKKKTVVLAGFMCTVLLPIFLGIIQLGPSNQSKKETPLSKKKPSALVLWILITVPIIASLILGYVNFGPQ